MCLVAMEKPCSLSPDDIRDEKLKVLRCIAPVSTDNVVVGQYSTGPHGQPAYVDDPGYPKFHKRPTFCTCVMYVKNEQWDGVPFIIKAKALNETKLRENSRAVQGCAWRFIRKPSRSRQTSPERVR